MAGLQGFRKSDNIEDRRKEHFASLQQATQSPNVFLGGNMTGLSWQSDFAPVPQPNKLSNALGTPILDGLIQKYLSDRQQPVASANLFDIFK